MSKATFIIQIASVPGNQVGQRRFEQCRYLHDLLVNTLIDRKEQIKELSKLFPQHKIALRSGFSQTAQWGLEPNMFIEIHGNERQARMISALFGKAFCQDGIGIGCDEIEGQNHSVLIVNKDWKNEDERLNFVSMILQHFPSLSAQLDINGQLAFHDYSMHSSYSFNDIIELINNENNHEKFFIEEQKMKSELVDQTEYENLLMLLESSHMRNIFNMLRHEHARLFSGYGCASLTLPSISKKHREKQHEQKQDECDKNKILVFPPSHLCTLVFISYQPFKYIARNEDNFNQQCKAVPDLAPLMVICGIFSVFFFSTAYIFLSIISAVSKYQIDISEIASKIVVGLITFIFGTITCSFSIILQIRVYGVYPNGVQFNNYLIASYCPSTLMRGALAMIILTYFNILLFIGIVIFVVIHRRIKIQQEKQGDIESAMD
ncbi:unnamed protein product [Rotaria sp. Silwood1]|nr:unnamed protein product [Rotaria sp. Silwood1]CAF1398990.1 unnamed protein product [Rotaria sp. Silwood1]